MKGPGQHTLEKPVAKRFRMGVGVSVLAAIAATSLGGCTLDIPRHTVGNWQSQTSYLKEYSVERPGQGSNSSVLNSCADSTIAPSLQCSGHGRCESWFPEPPGTNASVKASTLKFCLCDRDWAGPECGIQRKSQMTAFLLSLFLGIVGADQFYLGVIGLGVGKACTLGGLGLWWLFDIVRIGSYPVTVPNHGYRVAPDVPHWAFVLILLAFLGTLGFSLSVWSIGLHRKRRNRELLLAKADSQFGYGAAGSQQFLPAQQKEP